MTLLIAEARRLEGIKTRPISRLLHQLLPDDTGIFLNGTEADFLAVKDVIQKFERISGAHLNLEKSVLINLKPSFSHDSFEWAGCRIAQLGEIFTYLGSLIGVSITPSSQILEFLLGKVKKRFSHWANRLVLFVGQAILLKHILRSIPTYHFMLLKLIGTGLKKMERVGREFL